MHTSVPSARAATRAGGLARTDQMQLMPVARAANTHQHVPLYGPGQPAHSGYPL
jgi:hypothetical protein